jgi:hypothetical protein
MRLFVEAKLNYYVLRASKLGGGSQFPQLGIFSIGEGEREGAYFQTIHQMKGPSTTAKAKNR